MSKITKSLLLTAVLLAIAGRVAAQGSTEAIVPPVADTEKPTPYDDRLARLSEIIGAVHYLRNLCKADGEPEWRQSLQGLLDAETRAEPKRRARMTAAYNRGYRSFASVYTSCTPAAVRAEQNYRIEGATLATEITARFGN
ncbi:TIGR02301 family protein [Agrobacterium sp. MA01]|uniref:TIGR02301 family protein n=1 Tax=Agrobacterium sp. MA01 TaxID=2664893 RepID=UPI00129AF297|nr:TIGR02301 family protein [Agrobacterium sp. MA01]QGG89983.1 TIGR02301 family protein [Agrobacterium sp. MA01]